MIAPAFADQTKYQYKPLGFVELPRVRIPLTQPFQFPDNQVFLLGDISDDLIVVQFLPLAIEQDEDESYIVSDDIFLVYGDGATKSDALREYQASLVKYFQIIEKSAESNKFDKALLSQLQSYIQRRGNDAVQTNRS